MQADVKFYFRHIRRSEMKNDQFAGFVQHAVSTGQIKTHRTRIYKDIMSAEIVTVCMAITKDSPIPVAQGYSFCRGDMFDRGQGRWRAENRLRDQLGMELIPNPKDAIRRQREAAKLEAKKNHLKRILREGKE